MSPAVVSPTGLLPVVLDPDGDDPLDLNDGEGYIVHADLQMPPPAQKPQYATSIDTEGSIPVVDSAHYENREITFTVRVYGTSDNEVEDRLEALQARIGRIHRHGGVLGVTTPAGHTCLFDLVGEADADVEFGERWLRSSRTDVQVRLTAAPFGRSPEIEFGSASATASNEPVVLLTTDTVPGDVPALGRLVVTDLQGADQWQVQIGWQSTTYSPDLEAALYYQADSLSALGTSTYPGLGLVRQTDLIPTYQAVMSSKYRPTGAHLQHHGTYRVVALLFRPVSNTGIVAVQLEWGEGDLRRKTRNDAVTFAVGDRENSTTITDLGTVTISPESDRWEFQLLAASSVAGDELSVAGFLLFPTDDGYIELSGEAQHESPYALSARDEFDQTVGSNLNGLTAPLGGVWATSGAAGDFVRVDITYDVTGNIVGHEVRRAVSSDANLTSGRYAVSGVAAAAAQTVEASVFVSGRPSDANPSLDVRVRQAVVARFTDANNWLMAGFDLARTSSGNFKDQFFVAKRVAGTVTDLYRINTPVPTGSFWVLRVQVNALGQWWVWAHPFGSDQGSSVTSGFDDVLATSGALASGKPGFYEAHTGSVLVDRRYDNFLMFSPPAGTSSADAAIYANRTLELAHDGARRLSLDGETFGNVSRRAGRYLRLNPGVNRLIVKAMRNEPDTMPNGFVDDLKADLFVTPRWLVVPAS